MLATLRVTSFAKRLAVLAIALWSNQSLAGTDSGVITYTGCWNSDYVPPLLECTELNIAKSLKAVSVAGKLEENITPRSDKDYYVLRSNNIPIVIPKKNYENQNDWVYERRKYIKIKKNVSTLVENVKVDVIGIVENLDSIEDWKNKRSMEDRGILENTRITFWYTPLRGVEAISTGVYSSEMQVFFCTKSPCLFALPERKP